MDTGKEADGMPVFGDCGSFRHMVSLFKDIFALRTFRAVADNAKRFEVMAVGFDDIGIIDEDDGIRRDTFTDKREVRAQSSGRDAFGQVPGETVGGIDLFGVLVKLVGNIGDRS